MQLRDLESFLGPAVAAIVAVAHEEKSQQVVAPVRGYVEQIEVVDREHPRGATRRVNLRGHDDDIRIGQPAGMVFGALDGVRA